MRGERLDHSQLSLEQSYRLQKHKRHNRVLHGWGVVCGLNVVPTATRDQPWRIGICPGYAIDKHGCEVYVARRIDVDVARYAWQREHRRGVPVVTIEATEWDIRRVLVEQTVCCEKRATRKPHSRTKDQVRVRVDWLDDKSIISSGPGVDICDFSVVSCPPCPPSAAIPLAVLRLPTRDSERIESRHIRRM